VCCRGLRSEAWYDRNTRLIVIARIILGAPKIDISDTSATPIDQTVNIFEKVALLDEDLVRIASQMLADQKLS